MVTERSAAQPRRRRWLRRALVVCGLAWLGLQAVVLALITPRPSAVGPPPAGSGVVEVELPNGRGQAVQAWWLAVPDARGTALLAHGIGGTRAAMLGRMRLLGELGWSSLSIDLHAHGENPGRRVGLGRRESEDLRAALGWLEQSSAPSPRLGLGISLGGAAFAVADPPLELDGLLLESVHASLFAAVRERVDVRLPGARDPLSPVLAWLLCSQAPLWIGASAAELSPSTGLADVRVPLALFAGERDELSTPAETRRMAVACGVEPVWFPKAGHEDLLTRNPALYRSALTTFLSELSAPAL
jgi:predicted alpha/beta-hydrolase family hydrolase